MLRKTILGATMLAMAPLAVNAQDDMTLKAGADITANAVILDASQVETRTEAKLYAESEFLQADQNDDGAIDKAEFLAYAAARAPINDPALSIPDEVVDAKDITAETTVEGAISAPKTAEEQFTELSKGDETISETELVDTRVAQFDEADQNDDESLDDMERLQFAALTTLSAPENKL